MSFRTGPALALLVAVVACGGTRSTQERRSPAKGGAPSSMSNAGAGDDEANAGTAGSTSSPAGGTSSDGGATSSHAGGTSSSAGGTSTHTGGTSSHSGGTSGHTGGTSSHAGGANGGGTTSSAGENAAGESGQAGEGGRAGASDTPGGAAGDVPGVVTVPGFSARKRVHPSPELDFVLEEAVEGFNATGAPRTRLRRLTRELGSRAEWDAPDGFYISDFCVHPSGDISVVLVGSDFHVSLERLGNDLTPQGNLVIHDPEVANDPHAQELGITDLQANDFAWDLVRIGPSGEDAFAVVMSSINAVIGYRASFTAGTWSAPARALIEPPVGITPNIPIGGSFDTFGAIVAWFRPSLDLDADGNAYVVIWGGQGRIREHNNLFGDGLVKLPGDPETPSPSDADLLLTKLDAAGNRVWTRVVGSDHEDEPYALRATRDAVAVVGRSRRFPGFDNTFWDALVSVTTAAGDQTTSVTLELDASSILLGVDARPNGGWLLAGSDNWTQNPDGLSVLSNGNPLLLELPSLDAAPLRHTLTPGPRHNELHSVIGEADGIAFAGHEDGPLTHSGDADPSQIHATGVLGFVAR